MAKKTVEDIQVAGKRVLCRVDFNVPLTEDMKVADDKRIVAAMPTIRYLLDHEAKVILCSHLGRPKGKVDMKYTLAPVAARLQELLPEVRVQFASDTVGESAQKCVADMKDGEIVLLENTRFQKEEEANDPEFSRKLADLADIFVSDAFGTVHRAHASTAGVAAYLPAVAGFLIGKELGIMGEALNNPQRPFVAILGGAKVSDKIGVIKNLLEKCDTLLIGGGMAYTFFKAMGYEIGTSLLDENSIDLARTPRTRPFPPMPFPPAGWAWISVRRLVPSMPRSSRPPKPSFGMDPWACSSSPTSPKAPLPWPRPALSAAALRLLAAAIPLPR